MSTPNSRPHQLVGYAPGHLLADDGPIEWLENYSGAVPTYPTPAEAAAARLDADPETWPVIELRIVPEGASS